MLPLRRARVCTRSAASFFRRIDRRSRRIDKRLPVSGLSLPSSIGREEHTDGKRHRLQRHRRARLQGVGADPRLQRPARPGILAWSKSEIENGRPSGDVGCMRKFQTRQRRDASGKNCWRLSDRDYSRHLFDPGDAAADHQPHRDAEAVARHRRQPHLCRSGRASFDAPADEADKIAEGMGANVFQGGFDALKKQFRRERLRRQGDGPGLQTFATVAEAQSALARPGTRYMGGGTLVVRAANEGDLSFSTIVRATDPALSAIDIAGGRVTIGASVTMSAIVAPFPTSASWRRPRVPSAARRSATWRRSAAICSRRRPMAISPSRCWRSTRRSSSTAARCRSRHFLQGARDRTGTLGLVHVRRLRGFRSRRVFRFLKVSRVQSEGRRGAHHRRRVSNEAERRRCRSARIALGCMADHADPRQRGREGARRPAADQGAASRRRWPPLGRASTRRPMRSPAPGTGARSCRCISAGCCSA